MNVVSKQLSEELYELSGWGRPKAMLGMPSYDLRPHPEVNPDEWGNGYIPAYDLGYLLRKLPANFNTGDARGSFEFFFKKTSREYFAGYNKPEMGKWLNDNNHSVYETPCNADTPEDALALLAIELWKQGILKK